jgi:hypothetical protein
LKDKVDEGEDDFVRSVKLEIDGRPAEAIDVSVGRGHIIAVARVEDQQRLENNIITIFGAGHNERGQLAQPSSAEFIEDFVELPGFREWAIQQLVCVGYTSYVVVKKRPGRDLGHVV